jgi:hypothetical protein
LNFMLLNVITVDAFYHLRRPNVEIWKFYKVLVTTCEQLIERDLQMLNSGLKLNLTIQQIWKWAPVNETLCIV